MRQRQGKPTVPSDLEAETASDAGVLIWELPDPSGSRSQPRERAWGQRGTEPRRH